MSGAVIAGAVGAFVILVFQIARASSPAGKVRTARYCTKHVLRQSVIPGGPERLVWLYGQHRTRGNACDGPSHRRVPGWWLCETCQGRPRAAGKDAVMTGRPHRCDERCACPEHGTPLLYWPAGDDHACQDMTCVYSAGINDELLVRYLSRGRWPDHDPDPGGGSPVLPGEKVA